jgi:hypothetical protein
MAHKVGVVFSHWYHLFENIQESPQNFYGAFEHALSRRQAPDATVSRVDYRESSALSAKREYVRVSRGGSVIDVCAAPFGTGFFVSWWFGRLRPRGAWLVTVVAVVAFFVILRFVGPQLGIVGGLIATFIIEFLLFLILGHLVSAGIIPLEDFCMAAPLMGPLYVYLIRPVTFYKIDTALMFQEAVHNAVLETSDQMTETKGLRALSESERKPILRNLFKR